MLKPMNGSQVVIGFDGSPGSERALLWAVREAELRRMRLLICHAWDWPYPVPPSGPVALDTARKMAQHVLDRGVRLARETSPRTMVRDRLVVGSAEAVLVNQSHSAALAVVGAHGASGCAEQLVGSSSVQLPAYAHCPVIVVRQPAGGRRSPIVVGVDGSAASEAALGFGFEEAALRGRPLLAVYGCWEPEVIMSAGADGHVDQEELIRTAGCTLERTVAPWREKYPYVDARTSLVTRPPREALRDAVEDAGLLVVGGRGLGGVEGLRLGSVSSAMLHCAPCSVAVVRPHG
jgi:nucleotide-binding universal stress UspA family protein